MYRAHLGPVKAVSEIRQEPVSAFGWRREAAGGPAKAKPSRYRTAEALKNNPTPGEACREAFGRPAQSVGRKPLERTHALQPDRPEGAGASAPAREGRDRFVASLRRRRGTVEGTGDAAPTDTACRGRGGGARVGREGCFGGARARPGRAKAQGPLRWRQSRNPGRRCGGHFGGVGTRAHQSRGMLPACRWRLERRPPPGGTRVRVSEAAVSAAAELVRQSGRRARCEGTTGLPGGPTRTAKRKPACWRMRSGKCPGAARRNDRLAGRTDVHCEAEASLLADAEREAPRGGRLSACRWSCDALARAYSPGEARWTVANLSRTACREEEGKRPPSWPGTRFAERRVAVPRRSEAPLRGRGAPRSTPSGERSTGNPLERSTPSGAPSAAKHPFGGAEHRHQNPQGRI